MAARIGGDGLIQLALVPEGNAQIAVGLGVVGLEPDGRAVGGDGLIQLALAARALPRLLWASA